MLYPASHGRERARAARERGEPRDLPQESPGEAEAGEAGGEEPDPEAIRDLMRDAFRGLRDRGIGTNALFQGGGTGAAPADPGAYAVLITVGDETLERPLEVLRAPDDVVPEPERDVPSWDEIDELLRER